mgnify:CR=1 FL=1
MRNFMEVILAESRINEHINRHFTEEELQNDKGYKIENHEKGGLCCYFQVGDKYFFASLRRIEFVGNECMIFRANSEGVVTDWSGEFTRRELRVSVEDMIECMEDFKNGERY